MVLRVVELGSNPRPISKAQALPTALHSLHHPLNSSTVITWLPLGRTLGREEAQL